MMKRFRRYCIAAALVSAMTVIASGPAWSVKVAPVLTSEKGMVAAGHPLAAAAGAEILEKGGNAIDAAIAVSFALGSAEPFASGIGGEGYLVARMADGTIYCIDFRSAAPAMATYDNLHALKKTIREIASMPQGACVPGVVAGAEALYAKGGTLPLKDLLAPAIRIAENGLEVNKPFSDSCKDAYDKLQANAPDRLNEGMPWEIGEVYKNQPLADTLKLIAEKGFREFYEGKIAKDVDAYMREHGGWIRAEDLAAYKAIERKPIVGTYRGYEITVAGLPVGGPRILENLNMLENFNLANMGWDDPLRIHIMQEIFLQTGNDLHEYGSDPAFHYSPVAGMVSKDYAKTRLMKIKMSGATTGEEWKAGKNRAGDAGAFEDGKMTFTQYLIDSAEKKVPDGMKKDVKEAASTTHFSVVDGKGNAVSWTQTVSGYFGTGVCIDGFFLNNEMGNFTDHPSPDGRGSSDMIPGKRVSTSIAPMIIMRDGKVRWVLGAPGGGRIVPTLTEMIVDLIDFEMPLEKAFRTPKFCSVFTNGHSVIQMEKGFSKDTMDALTNGYGYTLDVRKELDRFFGAPNAVEFRDDGTFLGVGSVRRAGAAAAPEK